MNSLVDNLSPLETHPYNSILIPPNTKILIVGTAPPPRFSLPRPPHNGPEKGWDADFFYGSKDNYLWLYLERAEEKQIFAAPGTTEAANEPTEILMQDLLRRNRLWMRDVLQTYRRIKGREASAKDDHIDLIDSETTFSEFSSVLESCPNIEKVVFTGVKAAEWFFKKVLVLDPQSDNTKNYNQIFIAANEKRKIRIGIEKYTEEFCSESFGGRTIRFFVAPSPSGSAWGPDEQTCTAVYRQILFDRI